MQSFGQGKWFNVYTTTNTAPEWQGAVLNMTEFTDLMIGRHDIALDYDYFIVDTEKYTITSPYYAYNRGKYDVDTINGYLNPERID
jgi:hypothetical protein